MTKARRSTDFGTVILHALLVVFMLALIATGLRIATDDPESEWLRVLDPLLPVEHVWLGHLASGLGLSAVLAGYACYMTRARLQARVRLDQARVLTILRPGRPRWAALNVVVYWALMLALLTEIVTGVLLFAGAGRSVLDIHLVATFACIGAVVAHVALHAASGGIAQLSRIIHPAPLVVAPPPPDLGELLARELSRQAKTPGASAPAERAAPAYRQPSTTHPARFDASPLATAAATGLIVCGLAVGAEQSTRPTLRVVEINLSEAPRLDGDISDPVWAKTTPVSVLTTHGGDFGGSHQSRVEIRAVHDGVHAYFAFVWEDPTRSLKHMPLVKREGRWFVAASRDDMADESRFNEDKFAVLLARPGLPLIGGAIHLARQPLADRPPSSTERGLHYTRPGVIADVWQWRASHGGVVGHIDNCHFGEPAVPEAVPLDPAYQYAGGFARDPGLAGYESNMVELADSSGKSALLPRRLPRDLAAMSLAMGRIGDGRGESESAGARWWMKYSETEPYAPALDATIPDGTVIPSIVVPDSLEAAPDSIRGVARWASGRWTLEIVRRLYTGSPHDIAIKTGVFMWVAAFDHAEKRHTRHLRPFRLEVD